MSAAVGIYRDEMEVNYAVDFGRDREPATKRSRHPEYRRKGSSPTRVGGMHCRRSKRWTWGTGRGARTLNMRAFAGCLAFAVASMAANAFGVSFDLKTIGNPGNNGNVIGSGTYGAVSQVFKMASKETTNAQYAEFLNKVDASGTNPNSVYNASMGSAANGGIQFVSGNASGSKYVVKSGAGDKAVNYVTWFSAARFINWLQNGEQTNSSSMETGAYTLNNATSGAIVARNAGAQYFLPSANEWYKAAFYNNAGPSYYLWGTSSNTQPTNTITNVSLANAANFGGSATPTTGPIAVGSYVNTTSPYQLYDMIGNVTEFTDTSAGGDLFNGMGGNWNISLARIGDWNSNAALRTLSSTLVSQGNGFRVAAVPEPGTFVLAGMGVAGLFGMDWMKRRRKKLAA